eukprot:10649822-Alexandrium_andersonii.AAC.1
MGGPGRPSRLRRGHSSLLTCMWPVAPSGRAAKAGSVGMRCASEWRAEAASPHAPRGQFGQTRIAL